MPPDQATYALPYCPRPRREEPLIPGLTRITQHYGLTADRLLGQLLSVNNSTFCLERAFVPPHVSVLNRVLDRTLAIRVHV